MTVKVALGQDSHRFTSELSKPCVIGGVVFDDVPGLQGNSDADVVLHALCNAISGISGVNILGQIADDLCRRGVTDSRVYVREALGHLQNFHITHVSVSLECQRPKISPKIEVMKSIIAELLSISQSDIGITATTGEELTEFGKGLGVQAIVVVTAEN